MHNITKSVLLAALAAVATPAATFASVPSSVTQNVPYQMNYQGYLADPSTGAPYADGVYTLECRIWKSASSTSASDCLWGGKYSVYVKGGYFNIMLGDSAAVAVTTSPSPTYGNAYLWKALWNDTSASPNVRFLGVTPFQDKNGATISQPTEIRPRQQLLTAPFAFRAQAAQYADQAYSAFNVPGALTVGGTATFNGAIVAKTGTQSFGPIETTSSTVKLGGSTTASSSLPSVYDVGNLLYFKSQGLMSFAPNAGNMEFTVPSGYKMYVKGSGSFVSEAVNNTIGGTGATKITGTGASSIDLNGTGTMQLKTTNSATLEAGSSYRAYVKGGGVTLQSTSGDFTLNAKTRMSASAANALELESTGGSVTLTSSDSIYLKGPESTSKWGVLGRGDIGWAKRGSTTQAGYMVKHHKVTITIPAGTYAKSSDLSSLISQDYFWSVSGWDWAGGSSNIPLTGCSISGCTLLISTQNSSSSARSFYVWITGINKSLCGDNVSAITAP